jgi:hypothetical protein
MAKKKGGKRRLGAAHPAMKKWTIKKGTSTPVKKPKK